MPNNPIEKRLFEADVVASLLAFDPFVTQDFLPFGEELFVEERFFDEVGNFFGRGAHARGGNFHN